MRDRPTSDPSTLGRAVLDRRSLLALGVGAFVLAVSPALLGRRDRLVRRSLPVMGTIAEIAVVSDEPHAAQAAIDAALAELTRVDATMSRFSPASDIGRANRLAARGPVDVSADTAIVLVAALRWAEATDGAFDPCVGKALELWDVGHRRAPPARESVQRMAGRRLYRALDLGHRHARRDGSDERNGRRDGRRDVVEFADADAALDLGGIAKGFAVDRAVAALRERGVTRGLVNVGGDLYALGASEDGDPWRVGIRSPLDPSRMLGEIEVCDAAVATSGDYEQFFDHGGTRYHHLLDPATAAPRASSTHSLTVIADTCMTADAAATAVFGAPRREAVATLRRVARDARIVDAAPGV